MKKMISTALTVLTMVALVTSAMACKQPTDDTKDDSPIVGENGEVVWTAAFNPSFDTTSVKIFGADHEVLATSAGAMALNKADTSVQAQAGGYYESKTCVNFTTTGGAWGGVFFQTGNDNPIDLSAFTKVNIAVKGDMGSTAYWGLKLENTSDAGFETNFLNGTSTEDGEWTVYEVEFADLAGFNPAAFTGLGLWNPNSVDGTTAERDFPENYPAFSNVLLSVKFE